MVLSSLSLQNFRNFKKERFEFLPGVTIIVGPNTFGKTNILEAIYMLASGKSFRAEVEKEIISYGEEIARVGAEVAHENFLVRGPLADSLITNSENFVGSPRPSELSKLEVIITTGQVASKKAPKKQFLVNGVKKRMTDFIGNFFAVLFSPQDLQLITDSPSRRRRYLNDVLSSVDKEYRRALLVYEKGVRQRNKLLERIRERQASASQLDYWNKLLIDNGQVITHKREEFIDFINQLDFTEKNMANFKIVYEKNEISEERLKEKQEREIILGMTLVGPHRDDFVVNKQLTINNQQSKSRDLSIYGSRGEQRLAVLWLKLGELAFLEEKTERKPVLLLDDIFSELDKDHRDLVAQIIPSHQTIITTTEEKTLKQKLLKEARLIRLTR